MNNRQARKILLARWSKKFCRKVDKLYPAYYNEKGNYCMPSVARYYLIAKAWILVHRKINKYKDKFKKL